MVLGQLDSLIVEKKNEFLTPYTKLIQNGHLYLNVRAKTLKFFRKIYESKST